MAESESEGLARMVASGFEEVHKRFDSIEARLGGHDLRFDSIEARLGGHDLRFDSIEARLADLEVSQKRGFKEIGEKIDSVIATNSERITALERRQSRGRHS